MVAEHWKAKNAQAQMMLVVGTRNEDDSLDVWLHEIE